MKKLMLLISCICSLQVFAQDAIEYKTPPKSIYDLVMAPASPTISFDSRGNWALLMEASSRPGVEELAQPELRVAGLRINPNNFGPSRVNYLKSLKLKTLKSGTEFSISGLPAVLRASNVKWSPDEKKIAFTQTNQYSIDLYTIDVNNRKALKVNRSPLNLVLNDYSWTGTNTLVYGVAPKPASAAPARNLVPKGPVVQQNMGKVAGSPTYQDLIKSAFDEELFKFFGTVQLVKNVNGIETSLGMPAIISNFDASPDGKYLLLRRIIKPYSYLVPAGGFNATISILNMNGKLIKEVVQLPSSELTPRGNDNVLNAPRSHQWLANQPATLLWIEPLDSGFIKKKVDHHDEAFLLAAPFTGQPRSLVKSTMRLGSITELAENLYLLNEVSRAQHRARSSRLNAITGQVDILIDRSTDDAYNDPGSPVTAKNKFNRQNIRLINSNQMLMRGTGASPQGDLPFLSIFNLDTRENKIIWRSADSTYETVTAVVDFDKLIVITNKQTQAEQPNYYLRDLKHNTVKTLTNFPDQQPGLRGVSRQKVTYKRKDGVDLSADLYLPKGYDQERDGRLPVLMWAYPREFKQASDASQVRGTSHSFIRISYGSPVFWVTQGYAVMDNTEFPIVGEGSKQPNDNFIDQLNWSAEAAIAKITDMGIGDPRRVAVGGHSYGAFMTANLLAHTNLFKAGIARSGAYNRTLTPFGFQNEERTYWQAPDVYNQMSPFSHADKIKTPLLLIHGEADNNPGTFPMQSERLFNAIKGHGGTVRYVQLPYESHGYSARENVLHMLWEMHEWLDKYVKNAK